MDNEQVAEVLLEIGVLLELKGENPFKTRAYSSVARTLETLVEPVGKLVAEQRLGSIKGVGEALQQKITELVTTGRLRYYDELKASIPPGLLEMMQIQGLGPKKVKALYERLAIDSIDALETACKAGQVAQLDGFGDKTQAKILEGIQFRRSYSSRHLLSEAIGVADPILESLRGHPGVIRCGIAGSLRRSKEVIGDVDFLVSSNSAQSVISYFVGQPGVEKILAQGDTKASVILAGGIQADLRVVDDAEFPFALAYFTGSKEHNIVMRQRAIQRGLRLNEYGLFRASEETRDPALRLPCRTEEEIFEALDLDFIPPELREDHGEFSAAEKHELPRLIEWTDLRGSLHNHSNWSDGRESLEEVGTHAQEIGCDYWAVTDHSRSSFVANGLDAQRLERQLDAIAAINRTYEKEGIDFRLLTGSEVDILSEGKLDFDDDLLARLDVVVASVHQGFTDDEATMTRRLIRAAENRYVHMLGHITGRLLLQRQPNRVNQHAVIDACAETGTWIELNANPLRFDLDWRLWQLAKSKGVRCVINCDSHRKEQAGYLKLGAGIARKGWLSKENVVNTLDLPKLRKSLAEKRQR